jgi:uncharacterized membrane protein YeaQ/YmgE (transglycosylase-associated protein family)
MDIIMWIVFGLIAGSIANFLDPHQNSGGILGSMVLGIVGALVGGWIGNAIFGLNVTGFNFTSFLVAVAGSLLVLAVGRMLARSTV